VRLEKRSIYKTAQVRALADFAHRHEKFLFFFQAEDGIRDKLVTGVQTCALPIYALYSGKSATSDDNHWTASANDIFNNNSGNVGIGTTTPEFRLSIDNDGGIISKGTFGSGNAIATGGAGGRMIWYPKKGAFRAGVVNGTQWDDA